jgi:hypothetical protein
MSQQSELADWAYERLCHEPLSAALLVRMVRAKWGPTANPQAVHFFVAETLTCLLRKGDVEVGDATGSGFTPWALAPWGSDQKIEDEICGLGAFLEDESRYVFRKKD